MHPWTIVLALALTGYVVRHASRRRRSPLPPGPKGLPFFGIASKFPKDVPSWITYWRWGRQYGSPIVYFKLLGKDMLVINSLEVAMELLDSRGAIYSDRPSSTMFGDLLDRRNSVFFVKYGSDRFRQYRRLLNSQLNPRAASTYVPLQVEELRKFLRGLLRTPEKFRALIRRNAGAVILKVTYGYSVDSDDDHFVRLADDRIRISEQASAPGWMVDSIPILKYVPSWFPGARFKRLAAKWREEVKDLCQVPFAWVKNQMAAGTAIPSFTSQLLSDIESGSTPGASADERADLIMWVSSGLYAAGTDTTACYMANFFLAMTLFPDVQRRAQEELDALLGAQAPGEPTRLPEFTDRGRLPYVEAVIKEIHRWAPAGPIGKLPTMSLDPWLTCDSPVALPHATTEDDQYNGYWIPKGTSIITNRWAMLHDEDIYPDPMTFNPDRFLEKPESDSALNPDPETMIFGFGRRACPGVYMANNSIFLGVTSILATFNIFKACDSSGKEIKPEVRFARAIVAHPEEFQCSITPRSDAAIRLIES
ncbi:cytochrome P450 [Punctularia strigosozonata HHB-11173 SS5]|uniref:cytochrome P450 n=1 Tax=Punctularia strigosozonata (strain HHB-11173) TaxID=741275 RepID=UPI0004418699|nr:cytochrome P450 [Punctularia strigosozonata HHB-11173 SS5]EIN12999.1 cytochrome P450 [Punctularia strigosozonata HHB-11173 SS5]